LTKEVRSDKKQKKSIICWNRLFLLEWTSFIGVDFFCRSEHLFVGNGLLLYFYELFYIFMEFFGIFMEFSIFLWNFIEFSVFLWSFIEFYEVFIEFFYFSMKFLWNSSHFLQFFEFFYIFIESRKMSANNFFLSCMKC